MTGVQVQHGREIGQRGLEIGLGLFRRAGAIAIDAGAEEPRVGMVRIEHERPLDVRQRLVELAQRRQEAAPGQAPIRFVRFEFDGQIGVGEGLVGLPQRELRPGPRDDGFRPARPPPHGLVEILQGLLLPPAHAVADAAGQIGLGQIARGRGGSQADLLGIVGNGRVELPLAAVDLGPPAVEPSVAGRTVDLPREVVERPMLTRSTGCPVACLPRGRPPG